MAIQCVKCGAQLNDGAGFCVSCGTAQPAPQQPVQGGFAPPPPQPAPYQQAPPPVQQAPYQQPAPQAPPYQQPQAPPPVQPQAPYPQPGMQQAPPYQQPGYQQPGYPQQPGYQQPYPQKSDAETNKWMAVLGYILFFIPIIVGAHKTSPFVKFHVNQGFLFFCLWLVYSIVQNIVIAIAFSTRVYSYGSLYAYGSQYLIVTTILGLIYIPIFILGVLGIINAATGKTKPLPLIGKLFTLLK